MPTQNLDNITRTNYRSIPDFSIDSATTDSPSEQEETIWQNTEWNTQYGAFLNVAEYNNAILMKGIWHTGKGYTCDGKTRVLLEHMSGAGKEVFDDILFNADITSMAGGDSYTQIIRDQGEIVNLKCLNPGNIQIVYNSEGRIKEYRQTSKSGKNKNFKRFKTNEIFHLQFNKIADQMHGLSLYNKVKDIITADEESFEIMRRIMRQQAIPFIIWKLKTDNETQITNFKNKIKEIRRYWEDLVIPDDENLLEWEPVQISPSQIILEWRNDLRNKFYRAVGLPQIVPGGGEKGTGSESRTIYLAFEQLVAQRQLFLQNQIWSQLGLKIRLNPPTTMADLIGKTEQKAGPTAAGAGVQKSEINPTASKQ